MDTIKLTARARNGSGKSYTRKARSAGWIPAAFYGKGMEPINIEVDAKEFAKIVATKSQNKLIQLDGEGIPADSVAVVKMFDDSPVKDDYYYHIDFVKFVAGEPIKTRSYINFVGESEGHVLGGILNKVTFEIDVVGQADVITDTVDLDIAALKVPGNLLKAKDIVLPEGVSLNTSAEKVIVRLFK